MKTVKLSVVVLVVLAVWLFLVASWFLPGGPL